MKLLDPDLKMYEVRVDIVPQWLRRSHASSSEPHRKPSKLPKKRPVFTRPDTPPRYDEKPTPPKEQNLVEDLRPSKLPKTRDQASDGLSIVMNGQRKQTTWYVPMLLFCIRHQGFTYLFSCFKIPQPCQIAISNTEESKATQFGRRGHELHKNSWK